MHFQTAYLLLQVLFKATLRGYLANLVMRLLLANWLSIERISACQSGRCREFCSGASIFITVLDFPDTVGSLSRRRTWHLQSCAAGHCLLILIVVRSHYGLGCV